MLLQSKVRHKKEQKNLQVTLCLDSRDQIRYPGRINKMCYEQVTPLSLVYLKLRNPLCNLRLFICLEQPATGYSLVIVMRVLQCYFVCSTHHQGLLCSPMLTVKVWAPVFKKRNRFLFKSVSFNFTAT
jgi:hypothetical protein